MLRIFVGGCFFCLVAWNIYRSMNFETKIERNRFVLNRIKKIINYRLAG